MIPTRRHRGQGRRGERESRAPGHIESRARDGYEQAARSIARGVLAKVESRSEHAERAGDTAEPVRAPISVRAATSAAGVIHRALTLNNTAWGDADQIYPSEGGGGGVIFVGDPGGNLLVVKPNIRGVEERLSADLHHQMAATNRANSWKLGELPMRIATAADILAIRQRADALWVGPRPPRLVTLLADLAAGTTMIQESAPQGSKTLGRAMTDQTEAGGHFGTNAKQKVLATSPLKPLFNKPEYAETLGRAAAADLFMGNFDRLVGTLGNIENFMVNAGSKQIFLIDNIGANVSQDVFDTVGDGQAEFNLWANNAWVTAFKNNQVQQIASDAWSDLAPNLGALITLKSMLVTGHRTDQQAQQHQFLSNADQGTMDAKLALNNNAHVNTIVANFASGLTAGRQRITATGAALAAGAGTVKARRQAEARRLYITTNQTAAAAWQAASATYP